MSADEGGVAAGEGGVPASAVRFTVDIEISPDGQGAARRRRLALDRPQALSYYSTYSTTILLSHPCSHEAIP